VYYNIRRYKVGGGGGGGAVGVTHADAFSIFDSRAGVAREYCYFDGNGEKATRPFDDSVGFYRPYDEFSPPGREFPMPRNVTVRAIPERSFCRRNIEPTIPGPGTASINHRHFLRDE